MRHSIIRFAIVVCASVGFGSSVVLARQPACAEAPLLQAGTVTYVEGLDAGTTALFAVEIAEPGLVAVEIVASGTEQNIPWIEVLPWPCESGQASRGRFLERDLARQVLEVTTPGTYAARVGAVDPEHGLGRYALGVQISPGSPQVLKTGESENDDDTDDSNNEIVPFVFDGPLGARPDCEDDLNLCARILELGVVADGELSPEWIGDCYSFALDRAQVVRVESAGGADTMGTLHDATGHRLLVADDEGSGQNFAFTVQLPRGRYFVRVESTTGSATVYRLMISATDL